MRPLQLQLLSAAAAKKHFQGWITKLDTEIQDLEGKIAFKQASVAAFIARIDELDERIGKLQRRIQDQSEDQDTRQPQ